MLVWEATRALFCLNILKKGYSAAGLMRKSSHDAFSLAFNDIRAFDCIILGRRLSESSPQTTSVKGLLLYKSMMSIMTRACPHYFSMGTIA